jgi:hypothetical protein
MRLLVIWSAVAILAAGICDAALAKVPVLLRTQGAELVQLNGGKGRAVITGRGAIFLDMGPGWLRIIDLAGPGHPKVSDPCRDRARRVRPSAIEVRADHIGCRIWSGKSGARWQVIMRGRRINASASVRGSLTLDGVNRGRRGSYRIGASGLRRWPREAETFDLDRR